MRDCAATDGPDDDDGAPHDPPIPEDTLLDPELYDSDEIALGPRLDAIVHAPFVLDANWDWPGGALFHCEEGLAKEFHFISNNMYVHGMAKNMCRKLLHYSAYNNEHTQDRQLQNDSLLQRVHRNLHHHTHQVCADCVLHQQHPERF